MTIFADLNIPGICPLCLLVVVSKVSTNLQSLLYLAAGGYYWKQLMYVYIRPLCLLVVVSKVSTNLQSLLYLAAGGYYWKQLMYVRSSIPLLMGEPIIIYLLSHFCIMRSKLYCRRVMLCNIRETFLTDIHCRLDLLQTWISVWREKSVPSPAHGSHTYKSISIPTLAPQHKKSEVIFICAVLSCIWSSCLSFTDQLLNTSSRPQSYL